MQERYGFGKEYNTWLKANEGVLEDMYKSHEKVMSDLNNVKATHGVDVNRPIRAVKTPYGFKIYYLEQLVFMIDTKPYNMTIDEYWKSIKEEDEKNA